MSGSLVTTDTSAWRWPRLRPRTALVLFVLFVGVGLLQGLTVELGEAGRGSAVVPIVGHLTGAVAAWAALPLVELAALNATRRGRLRWPRFVLVHVVGYASFAALHVVVMMALRFALARGFGIPIPTLPMKSQVLWELQSDLVLYGGLAALLTLLHAWGERRAAEARAARLEAQLTTARLEALTAQLDPHFLFNALNTVSALMYEDLPRTERLLANLGEVLRAALAVAPSQATWPLAAEREHTRRYVELLEARFGARLAVAWDIAADADLALVPRFALQMLVDNAVKHNEDNVGPMAVRVRAERRDGGIAISVEDDGRGFEGRSPAAARRSLGRLEETLHLLHGARARFDAGDVGGRGARVALWFPLEESR